jgi:hypothetical protein
MQRRDFIRLISGLRLLTAACGTSRTLGDVQLESARGAKRTFAALDNCRRNHHADQWQRQPEIKCKALYAAMSPPAASSLAAASSAISAAAASGSQSGARGRRSCGSRFGTRSCRPRGQGCGTSRATHSGRRGWSIGLGLAGRGAAGPNLREYRFADQERVTAGPGARL